MFLQTVFLFHYKGSLRLNNVLAPRLDERSGVLISQERLSLHNKIGMARRLQVCALDSRRVLVLASAFTQAGLSWRHQLS